MSTSIPLKFSSDAKAAFKAAHKNADVAIHLSIDGEQCEVEAREKHSGSAADAVAQLADRVDGKQSSVHLIPSGCVSQRG